MSGINENFIAGESREKIETEVAPVDVRDYFVITKFQKKAESIDEDFAHPWNDVQYKSFLCENAYGVIVAGETYSVDAFEESEAGLLIAEKTNDGQHNSLFLQGLKENQCSYILDAINIVVPCLSDELRHQFIRKLLQEAQNLKEEKVIAERLATMALELLSDYPDAVELEAVDWWRGTDEYAPTIEQQARLGDFTQLVVRKIPREKFASRIQKFKDDLRFIDDPYGRNYQSIFAQMEQWVLSDREDTQRKYDLLQREKPAEYSISEKVKRPITSIAELQSILSTFPVEVMPDVSKRQRGKENPEMVRLDQIVGGTGIKDWSVSVSQGRGLPKIFELTQELETGRASVAGRDEPIRLIEADGKYFIESDGRHRTAALKALGVQEVPAMVTHIK